LFEIAALVLEKLGVSQIAKKQESQNSLTFS